MNKLLVLLGSGEYTSAVNDIDSIILSKSKPGPILLIPTAAGQEPDYQKWNDLGVEHFKNLGSQAIGIAAPTRLELDSNENLELLQTASIIYFSGGRPDYLFSELQGTKFLTNLIDRYDNGLTIVASSAGAMVVGSHFLSNPYEILEKNEKPYWKAGLGFTEYVVLPHYNHIEMGMNVNAEMQPIIADSPQEIRASLIGIDEDTAYILETGQEPIIKGVGSVHMLNNKDTL